MAIKLFNHNEKAYEAAEQLLRETGKAAIVHPTGTGKSFIGFKLCEMHPQATVCWLSPSEYIYKTQLENLALTSDGWQPENICFFTYARLMLLSKEELREIRPAYIILDEFHRCGAEQWGKGVQALLSIYKDTPILGLSATNIRYLDNQRDMAEELFAGNVASEMTLGEAIVRGILHAPTYITSVYSYEKDLALYERRVKRAKNKAARDAAETLLDALRRALEKAEGLGEIFYKHMKNPAGKYIVFCAGAEHMREMLDRVPEWFGRVDAEPHIYTAYSDDPGTSRAFADFKQDDSRHLKLLFCIDMLNEGVHVDDVTGVILFRPTVSPIIYKQQIGRALSAGKSTEPIIFDIVNNFENLYSIGALEQEMEAAMSYYRFLGEGEKIVTDHFTLFDMVRDCRALFEELNETLSASWDIMYGQAKSYYEANGHLEIPKRYKTAEGYSLGTWIQTQRQVRSGEQYGSLDEARIAKLDAIGMVWDSVRDLSWEKNLAEARAYFAKYGNLDVPVSYMTEARLNLGVWISRLRGYRKSKIQQTYLTDARMKELDALGMIWDVPDYLWEQNYQQAMRYFQKHGNLDVPAKCRAEDGTMLGAWIFKLRNIRKGTGIGAPLTEEQIRRLDEIGMIWTGKNEHRWEQGFSQAQAYYRCKGNLDVPVSYTAPSGFKLGDWVSNQRETQKRLTDQRRSRLDAIGMVWQKPDSWELRYALARDYYEKHGNLKVPAGYVVKGIWLQKWLNEQKQIYHGRRQKKVLTPEQIRRLTQIGMQWARSENSKYGPDNSRPGL